MKVSNLFDQYTPSLIDECDLYRDSLDHLIQSKGILICGEVHGAIENANILYTLVVKYGFDTIGLEQTEEAVGEFIDSLKLENKPNFKVINNDIFFASVLSPQYAKAIHVLLNEKRLSRIVYIDSDDNDIEKSIANNIMKPINDDKMLCVLGNWHTTLNTKGHKSALEFLRAARPGIPYIKYEYLSGRYYNVSTGVDDFNDDSSHRHKYELISESNNNYRLIIPQATPINEG